MKRILLIMLISFMAMSCTYAISKETRETAVMDVSFKAALENIQNNTGKVFIWGGFIAKIQATDEGTYMEVVENPIDKYGNITDTDSSEGRFLALYKGHLEQLIYEKGRLVTIAGELTGGKEGTIGQMKYVFPVLTIKEIHLWSEEVPYAPYYQTYPPYPWWYDPWRMWYGPYWP